MFKLINQDRTTRKGYDNETTWPIGEWREATGGPEQELCSSIVHHNILLLCCLFSD